MKVLIAGGGTGGHLFPGIALAQEIKERPGEHEVVFVGTARGIEATAVPKAGFPLELLPVAGLRSVGLLGLLRGLFYLPLALWKALALVWRHRPHAAISVGGYAAGPAVLAARILGVPCFVMEQNAIPGFTNKVLAKLSRKVFAALPLIGVQKSKVMVLGNPVRAGLADVAQKPYAPKSPISLFVFGGSQGARPLNKVMPQVMALAKEAGVAIHLKHQTGKYDYDDVCSAYEALGIEGVETTVFIDDMAQSYEEADLVLCRSGATSIAELTVCGRPAILVPFPFAVDDHQTKNARALEAEGAAICVPQETMSPAGLWDLIAKLAADPERLKSMAQSAKRVGHPKAAKEIADAIWQEVAGV